MTNFKVYAHAGENHTTSSPQARTIQNFDQDMPMMMARNGWMKPWFLPFSFVFYLLIIVLLLVLIRYFWNKGNK